MEQWIVNAANWIWSNIETVGPWLATALVSGIVSEVMENALKSSSPIAGFLWLRRLQSLVPLSIAMFVGAWLKPMGHLNGTNNVLYFMSAAGVGLLGIDAVVALLKKRGIQINIPGISVAPEDKSPDDK